MKKSPGDCPDVLQTVVGTSICRLPTSDHVRHPDLHTELRFSVRKTGAKSEPLPTVMHDFVTRISGERGVNLVAYGDLQ